MACDASLAGVPRTRMRTRARSGISESRIGGRAWSLDVLIGMMGFAVLLAGAVNHRGDHARGWES